MNGVPVTGAKADRPPRGPAASFGARRTLEERAVLRAARGAGRPQSDSRRSSSRRGRIGSDRVAVVLPTLTWQAYNFRDDDGDGKADTWYAGKRLQHGAPGSGVSRPRRAVRVSLPLGLPALAVLDEQARRRPLAVGPRARPRTRPRSRRAYDLVVFAGHHEYVTTREYDLVEGYRDLGGNLMFLSANNYFWRVDPPWQRHREVRDAGEISIAPSRHSSAFSTSPTSDPRDVHGLFAVRPLAMAAEGTGSHLARRSAEVASRSTMSRRRPRLRPRCSRRSRTSSGRAKTAQMTYYETRSGARVFAAGAFHFTRTITTDFVVWRLLENLWTG